MSSISARSPKKAGPRKSPHELESMSQKVSRREFARRAAASAAGLALVPAMAKAQQPEQPKPPPVSDAEIADVESQLAKPLSEEARKLLKSSIEGQKQARAGRMKSTLPENSEPCFTYIPATVEHKR